MMQPEYFHLWKLAISVFYFYVILCLFLHTFHREQLLQSITFAKLRNSGSQNMWRKIS